MKKDMTLIQRLKESGATDDMIALYQSYLVSENRKGQERILCRCRRMKNEALQVNREKITRLDYIIASVEQTNWKE